MCITPALSIADAIQHPFFLAVPTICILWRRITFAVLCGLQWGQRCTASVCPWPARLCPASQLSILQQCEDGETLPSSASVCMLPALPPWQHKFYRPRWHCPFWFRTWQIDRTCSSDTWAREAGHTPCPRPARSLAELCKVSGKLCASERLWHREFPGGKDLS